MAVVWCAISGVWHVIFLELKVRKAPYLDARHQGIKWKVFWMSFEGVDLVEIKTGRLRYEEFLGVDFHIYVPASSSSGAVRTLRDVV